MEQKRHLDWKIESQVEELEIMQKNGHLVRFLSGESNQCVFAKKKGAVKRILTREGNGEMGLYSPHT